MRALRLALVALFALIGCSQREAPPKQPHDSAGDGLEVVYTAPDATDYALSGLTLAEMQARLFRPDVLNDKMESRTESFRAALAEYQLRLVEALRSEAPGLEGVIQEHRRALSQGCREAISMIDFGSCPNFPVFAAIPSSAEVLTLLAAREGILERRYQLRMTALSFQNLSVNRELSDAYLLESLDFAICLQNGRCQTEDNRAALARHVRYVSLLAGRYSGAPPSELLKVLREASVFRLAKSSPLWPLRDSLMNRFGRQLIYADGKVTPEFNQAIESQQSSPKSLSALLSRLSSPADTPVGRAERRAFTNMIPPARRDFARDEILYTLDGLYLGELTGEEAVELRQGSGASHERWLEAITKYSLIRLLETILNSNAALKSEFDRARAQRGMESPLALLEIRSREVRDRVWEPYYDANRRLRDFYTLQFGASSPGSEAENFFYSLSSNINALARVPNMWLLGHIMQESQIDFGFVSRLRGNRSNRMPSAYNSFFRDLFETQVWPWFDFGGSDEPVSRQGAILGFHNLFRLGLFDLYEVEPQRFLSQVAEYYLAATDEVMKVTAQKIDGFLEHNAAVNRLMGLCAREAEARCDGGQNEPRICRHRDALEKFKIYGAEVPIDFDDLSKWVYVGFPAGLSEASKGSEKRPVFSGTLALATDFYFLPGGANRGQRRMDEMIEITREDALARIAHLEQLKAGLLGAVPGQTGVSEGLRLLEARIKKTRDRVENIWAQVLKWDNRMGDCTLLLYQAENERQWQIVEAEARTLRAIHADMTTLRERPELKDQLNAKYRDFSGTDIFKNLDEVFPASAFGFDGRQFNFNVTLFLARTAKYLKDGVDPRMRVDFPADGRRVKTDSAMRVRPVEWNPDAEAFVNAALARVAETVHWFEFPVSLREMATVRGKFLVRLLKLGRVEFSKAALEGERPMLYQECDSKIAGRVCLQPNIPEFVDQMRAQAQLFQLSEQDRKWLPRLGLNARVNSFMLVKDFYCDYYEDTGMVNQCSRFTDHFDFYFREMKQSTSVEQADSRSAKGFAFVIPRSSFLNDRENEPSRATEFQRACTDRNVVIFRNGLELFAPVNAYMQARVAEEFRVRAEFKDAVINRRREDVARGQQIPIEMSLIRPAQPEPDYVSRPDLEDYVSFETIFRARLTNGFYGSGQKCSL